MCVDESLLPGSCREIEWRFIEDPIFHAIVLIALTRLGIVTVSGTTRGFSWHFAIDAVVADQPFEFPAGKVILAHADWTSGEGEAREQQYLYRAAPGDVCRIFLASGTNGKATRLQSQIA